MRDARFTELRNPSDDRSTTRNSRHRRPTRASRLLRLHPLISTQLLGCPSFPPQFYVATQPEMPTTIESLPAEVLPAIFLEVDEPGAFSRTCKAFRAVTTSTYSRYRWHVYRWYPCEVVWHALLRWRIADGALLLVREAGRKVGPEVVGSRAKRMG